MIACNNCGMDSCCSFFPPIPIILDDRAFVELDPKTPINEIQLKHFCSPKCLVEWIGRNKLYHPGADSNQYPQHPNATFTDDAVVLTGNGLSQKLFLERGGNGNFFIWNNMERPLFASKQEARKWMVERWVPYLLSRLEDLSK